MEEADGWLHGHCIALHPISARTQLIINRCQRKEDCRCTQLRTHIYIGSRTTHNHAPPVALHFKAPVAYILACVKITKGQNKTWLTLFEHQLASIGINQYQHQSASTNIIHYNQHQSASSRINQYQLAPTNINQHQSASSSINHSKSISSNRII